MSRIVRPMREEDVPEVVAIAAGAPTAPHWPEFEFRRMLHITEESPSRRSAWVALDTSAKVQGFAIASQVAGVAELEAVVTSPTHRREGFGLALTQRVIAWSRGAGAARVVLEARASNAAALGLYARLGFGKDGVRRAYYRNPEEDAVLLSLAVALNRETERGGKQPALPSEKDHPLLPKGPL